MQTTLIAGNIVGVAGLIIAGYYALRTVKMPGNLSAADPLHAALRRLRRCRRRTAVVMAVVAGLFLAGINLLHHSRLDGRTIYPAFALWSTVMILLVIMVVFALMDLRAVEQVRNELQTRLNQQFRETVIGPSPDDRSRA